MSTPIGLPAIFEQAPINLVPAQRVATFPENTFLESIVIANDQTLFLTSHLEGKILRIRPQAEPELHATIPGKPAGLAWRSAQDLLVTGWDQNGICSIFQVTADGTVTLLLHLPEAMFLNGIIHLADDLYLIADSYRGAIWLFDAAKNAAQIWLDHPLLARSSNDQEFPAANGLKIFNQILYVSNTEKQLLLKIPIVADSQPSEPEIFLDRVNIDDFDFDLKGNLYATTHIYNSVIKITPTGAISTIAEAAEGMVGSTALVFNANQLYVVTNGGMSLPLPTGVESAKVVQLDIG